MRLFVPACLIAVSTLTACSQFPDFASDPAIGTGAASYPDLVPVETLRADPASQTLTEDTQRALETRIARLRARAAQLSDAVVDGGTRARMSQGVPQP